MFIGTATTKLQLKHKRGCTCFLTWVDKFKKKNGQKFPSESPPLVKLYTLPTAATVSSFQQFSFNSVLIYPTARHWFSLFGQHLRNKYSAHIICTSKMFCAFLRFYSNCPKVVKLVVVWGGRGVAGGRGGCGGRG